MVPGEIDLSVYAASLWKRKFTILAGAVAPAIITAAILLCLPPKRSVIYTYFLPWRGEDYRLFETYFYQTENLINLENSLRNKGFDGFANHMSEARQTENNDRMIELLMLSRMPGVAEREKDKEDVIQNVTLRIRIRSYKEPTALAAAVCDYFEQRFPLYRLAQINTNFLREQQVKILDVQTTRTELNKTIQSVQSQLDLLKKLKPNEASSQPNENLIAPIITGRKEFFPVEYQIRAVECQLSEIHQKLQETELTEAFLARSIQITDQCEAKINDLIVAGGKLGQFEEYLHDLLRQDRTLTDVLQYNLTATDLNTLSKCRLPHEPTIHRASRGTVLFSALAFAIALPLMIGYALIRSGALAK